MIANYHTHTYRCNHATGTEEEYIQVALDRKFEILGFADHTPWFFPGEYYSGFRMRPEQLSGYCETVLSLRQKYAGKIRIPLGLELEYYPNLMNTLLPVIRDAGIEYLLLGQHFIGDEIGEPYSGKATSDVDTLRRYCRQSMEAMNTGLFTYFAHPDLIHFVGDRGVYTDHMRCLVQEAKSCGMPLEINLLGLWSGRQYPNPLFWELVAEEGCSVVIGCDAHAPEQLRKLDAEAKVQKMIRSLGLTLMDKVELKRI